MKIKYALPIAQMVFACLLVAGVQAQWNAFFHSRHGCDSPGSPPLFEVLLAINAPLVVPRVFWEALPSVFLGGGHYLPFYWSTGIMVTAVGFFWFWVALNVQAWRQRRMVLMFRWRPAQFVTDTLIVVSGLLPGLLGVTEMRDVIRELRLGWLGNLCYVPIWVDEVSAIIVPCALLCWSFVLAFFYGRDLIYCVRSKTPT
jgi:hypothetical protein